MDDHDLAALAQRARAFCEAHPEAPEGIELFRWVWGPAASHTFRYAAGHGEVEIRPRLWLHFGSDFPPSLIAQCGWDAAERVAVLFFAQGGPEPLRSPATSAVWDQRLHQIADAGAQAMREESAELIRRLLSDLGYCDGDEWKAGDSG